MSLEIWYHLSTKFGACSNFFGLPAWNEYINGGGCGPIMLNTPEAVFNVLPLIGLAILDMLLRIAGAATVFFVIYGGIQYVISQGSPDATKSAQNTIINALVGMLIAVIAVSAVSYIGRTLGAR